MKTKLPLIKIINMAKDGENWVNSWYWANYDSEPKCESSKV